MEPRFAHAWPIGALLFHQAGSADGLGAFFLDARVYRYRVYASGGFWVAGGH